MILGYKGHSQFVRTYALLFGASVTAFIVRIPKLKELGWPMQINLLIASTILAIVFWEILRGINHWLNKKLPFENNISKRIIVQLLLGALVGLTIRFTIYKFGEPALPLKLDSLFLAATWALYVFIPVGINLGFFTVHFIGRWKDSIVRAERLEKEKSQVQFDNLKNQLNPHFLFNALTSLNSLIFENQGLASQFLQHLSKVYRYVLQNKDKNFVALQTELDFIQNYVFLLETRFEQAIKINFDIMHETRERAIVPVTLQILLENAIKHNIVDKDKPLQIDILTIGDYLVVSNNLQQKKRVETSNKMGLENLKSLYRFLIEKPVLIEVSETRFAVKVPLI
ncbi:sensor histidine kinase [Pseudochryseolinea flava]|uniref:Histidine kinase n=1 Tax=Pseudochryseolinea flava TaxID=2059302 RepID=A0A364XTQ2_9BACT|nr:histidine kinase [Pseudochryseolinea flava]RAV97739.1 histidine kinase [Pseudochryseolinea flava]